MPTEVTIDPRLNIVKTNVEARQFLEMSLIDWRKTLAIECGCFVHEDGYLCRRLEQINYTFESEERAKMIVADNLNWLLKYKYLPLTSDDVDKRIKEIVGSFITNLRTNLRHATFNKENRRAEQVHFLEDGQIAFKNGVFDFRKNDWLFKYDLIEVPSTSACIYMYDPTAVITWYFEMDFEPIAGIDVNSMDMYDFLEIMREIDKSDPNYCTELLYNMSHNEKDIFDPEKFKHLCEIIGFSCCNSFIQSVVLFIGQGSNGKNSLFDGCFTQKVRPTPSSVSLDDIEQDRFVTGSLENHAQNIYLETSAKTYTESRVLKNITGSMYQMVEQKGVQKYSSIINVHMIYSGNDQEKVKFSDTTNGFRRRINIYEVYYMWDKDFRFLTRGDYYRCQFSDDLKELKSDPLNTIAYIYFAMFGIISATANFSRSFKFSKNDWKMSYSDIDFELKDRIDRINLSKIAHYVKINSAIREEAQFYFYDTNDQPLFLSKIMQMEFNVHNITELLNFFDNEELTSAYFAEREIYISTRLIQMLAGNTDTPSTFASTLKKLYSLKSTHMIKGKSYIKVGFSGSRLYIREQ